MSHHTPGPWIVESDGVSVAMGGQVVIVAPAPDGAGRDVERANARLIAEAPAMLAALTEALDLVPRISEDDPMSPALAEWCRGIKAIVARIEGKP